MKTSPTSSPLLSSRSGSTTARGHWQLPHRIKVVSPIRAGLMHLYVPTGVHRLDGNFYHAKRFHRFLSMVLPLAALQVYCWLQNTALLAKPSSQNKEIHTWFFSSSPTFKMNFEPSILEWNIERVISKWVVVIWMLVHFLTLVITSSYCFHPASQFPMKPKKQAATTPNNYTISKKLIIFITWWYTKSVSISITEN